MTKYFAVSAIEPRRHNWFVLASGTNKLDVERDALDEIDCFAPDGSAWEALLKNLAIMPIDVARRFVSPCRLGEHDDRCSCF